MICLLFFVNEPNYKCTDSLNTFLYLLLGGPLIQKDAAGNRYAVGILSIKGVTEDNKKFMVYTTLAHHSD